MDNNKIKIRKAKITDALRLCKLYDLLLGNQNDAVSMEEKLTEFENDENNAVLVAESEGKTVGTLQLCFCKSLAFGGKDFAVFDYFIVEPKYRRMGIGKELFKTAEMMCADRGVSCILFVSGSERKEAHVFYKAMGYDINVNGFRKDFV